MMSRLVPLRRGGARGQSLVEFALVFPIFVLLLFGLIDLARYVYVTNAFNQSAREAARFGAVEQWSYSCPTSVPVASRNRFTCTTQVARDRIAGAPAYFTPSVTCLRAGNDPASTVSAANCRPGYMLKVVITTPTTPADQRFTFFTPVIGQLIGPVQVTGQALVVVQ